jgi:hypothetical protein
MKDCEKWRVAVSLLYFTVPETLRIMAPGVLGSVEAEVVIVGDRSRYE